MSKLRSTLLWLLALSLLATACGSDSDDESAEQAAPSEESTTNDERMAEQEATADEAIDEDPAVAGAEQASDFPVAIESAGGSFVLESAPQRIISLSPTATEMLFAIGADDQVVAVDAFSTYPEGTPVTDLSGFDPNVEAVLGFEPDLVVIANDANDLVAGLTAAGVPVLVSAAPIDIESGYDTFAELGQAVGRVDETAEVIADMRAAIDAALSGPQSALRVYHEVDDTYYSASSFGFVGSIYAELGLENIADVGDPDRYGFPQLAEEYIVEADPELIVITNQVGYTADDVAARPGWDQISAVRSGNIVTVNADIASRWGPRLPEFIEAVTAALSVPAES